jgi:hypothetical protein
MKIIVEPGIIDLSKMDIPDIVIKHALSITMSSTSGEVFIEVSNDNEAVEVCNALNLMMTSVDGDDTIWNMKKKPQTVIINSSAATEIVVVLAPAIQSRLTQILFEGYGLIKSVRNGYVLEFGTIYNRLTFMNKFTHSCFLFADEEWRMLDVVAVVSQSTPPTEDSNSDVVGESEIEPPSYIMPAFLPTPRSLEICDTGAAVQHMLTEINTEFVNLNKKIETVVELAKTPKCINIETQLRRMAADPAIETINHFNDYLGVRTNPVHFIDVKGVKRSIGRLMIAIPYNVFKHGDGSKTIKVYNMDRTIEGNQAPHVFGGGDVCFGNIKGTIDNLIKMGDLYAAVQAIILFFQHPDEKDEMGRFAKYYPEVD